VNFGADACSVESVMGWLRLVVSLKLQVSFAEYLLFYRAFLHKRPINLYHFNHRSEAGSVESVMGWLRLEL